MTTQPNRQMTAQPNRQLNRKRVLFATVPAEEHFNQMTGLAKSLQGLGCDVRWYTSGIFSEKLEKLNIPHYTFKNAEDINPMNFIETLIYAFGNRSGEYYKDIQALYQSFPFDLMVADNTFSAIPLVRHKMNIPVVSIGKIPYPEDSEVYVPFENVMPYAYVYVTNGGFGGTHLSIRHNLPMVATGVYEGKNEVCVRIGRCKLGIDLKSEVPSPNAIQDAVNEALTASIYCGIVTLFF
jgi:UDP:flavonoid glycosyltransferase YjiC (YdhE family)